jgi:guanosine-3',5'-bis(diphosphate) 3'-pyrophosphohydrolase
MITSAKPTDLAFVLRAADFAARRHADQRRKGPDQEPYVNHLIEVANHLSQSAAGHDPILLAAGLLHDTVEDTETTVQELESAFGQAVAQIVAEVTDDKSLPSETRKRLQIERITFKSERAQLLSMADKTANVSSLLRSAPANWPQSRIVAYGVWAEAVVAQIRSRDAYLETEFFKALAALRQRHGS